MNDRLAPPAGRVADSVFAKFGWGRTLELGRSRRTLMMLRPPVCATAPRFNNCVEGAYGIARFAEREAVESDGHARSTAGCANCASRLCGSGRPPSIVCGRRSGWPPSPIPLMMLLLLRPPAARFSHGVIENTRH